MKKLIFLFAIVLLLSSNINIFANVATDYDFIQFPGTYVSISGDTVAFSTSTTTDPFQLNDVTYGPFALPFTFIFDCRDYNSIFIQSNGFITFGSTAPGISNYGAISSGESYEGAIAAYSRDLIGVFGTSGNRNGTNVLTGVANFQGVVIGRNITGVGIPALTNITSFDPMAGTITLSQVIVGAPANIVVQIAAGSIVRTTTGLVGSRIHTIQWTNFRQYIIEGTDDNFNFQIKLFEDSAKIQVVYGNMDKNATGPEPIVAGQVGLRGLNATQFNNRTNDNTLNWATSTGGGDNAVTSKLSSTLAPVPGQTYQWRPNANCVLTVEMSSFVSSIYRRDVTLDWTTASETNNSLFEIERSVVNPEISGQVGQWSKVGSVQGNGTTLSSMNYSFTDRDLNTGVYNYRLKQIDFNGNFEYFNLSNEVNVGIPAKFDLLQNYPNPFNPSTKINYDLPYDGKVTLKIFDISGKEVSTLVNEFQTAGYYSLNFNANNLSSGIYFYSLTSNDNVITKKMLLVK